jgi:probable HAF family extracellular repeat protein
MRQNRFAMFFAAVGMGLGVGAAWGRPVIAPVGPLNGDLFYDVGINGSGQIALGSFSLSEDAPINRAYRYDPVSGTTADLGALSGGVSSYAGGINSSGQMTGSSDVDDVGTSHAFRHSGMPGAGGVMVDLGTLGGPTSAVIAIIDAGGVAGFADTAGGFQRAFLSVPGEAGMRDLGTLGGNHSSAFGINASGQIAGTASRASAGDRAFRYDPTSPTTGVMRDLGVIAGFSSSSGQGMNDAGQVVGQSNFSATAFSHAFRYDGTPGAGGVMVDLGASLGAGVNSNAFGINSQGITVGQAEVTPGEYRAILWRADGSAVNLDAWLDLAYPELGQFWTLTSADAISSANWLTGTGTYTGPGAPEAPNQIVFLLDASSVPEPRSGALVALAGGALLRRLRR